MAEIIFDKSKKNLKKVLNRLTGNSVAKYVNREEVLFLAIGGYNRTYELLLAMGLTREEIATFSNLNLSGTFIEETHLKKVLLVKKINYLTSVLKGQQFSRKSLDLNIADAFEESMLIYKHASRKLGNNKQKAEWIKPSVVILDDPSLNLQTSGHRFYYQTELGFVQIRNRNADPYTILQELDGVEEAEKMMFALYQDNGADESEILDALDRLRTAVSRKENDYWYLKPTEFKKIVGSNELATSLKEIQELGIEQLTNNKKLGKENARWVTIPATAFDFKGFDYKDEEDMFIEELATEEEMEARYALEQEKLLDLILFEEFPMNIKIGYVGKEMTNSPAETLHSFLSEIDDIEQEVSGVSLLKDALNNTEYKHIKKVNLAYFLDGEFKDNIRNDESYLGGKRLISIDIDDGDYTRSQIESKLESQGLFGLVYPTAKHYFDKSLRWRLVLMADEEMTKETYKTTVDGVAKMLDLEIDAASKKISQLMGYPLVNKDVSTVIGSMVNVAQFKKEKTQFSHQNVVEFKSNKSLLEFNHVQAKMMRDALENGVQEGYRNESYRQIIMFLRDIQTNAEMINWRDEAFELEESIKTRMQLDGLDQKEMELICR